MKLQRKKKKKISIISICSPWKAHIPNSIHNKVSAHLCARQTSSLSPFTANLTPGWRCADKVAHCVIVGNGSGEISHSGRDRRTGIHTERPLQGSTLDGCRRRFSCRGKAKPIIIALTGSKCLNSIINKKLNPKPTIQTPSLYNFSASGEKVHVKFCFTILHFHRAFLNCFMKKNIVYYLRRFLFIWASQEFILNKQTKPKTFKQKGNHTRTHKIIK